MRLVKDFTLVKRVENRLSAVISLKPSSSKSSSSPELKLSDLWVAKGGRVLRSLNMGSMPCFPFPIEVYFCKPLNAAAAPYAEAASSSADMLESL